MKNEKSRPGAATPKRQTEMDTPQAYSIPRPDSTTGSGTVQGIFSSILPVGAENAMKTAELKELLGLSDERVIRKMVADERAAGAVILSNSAGYFLPADGEQGRQEAAAFIATLTAKGANTLKAVESAQAFLDKLPGQMEMGESK